MMERQIGNRVLYTCDKCGKEYAVFHNKKIVYTGFTLFEGFKDKLHFEFCKECEREFMRVMKDWLGEPTINEPITDEQFQKILDRVSREYRTNKFHESVRRFNKEVENEAV